MVLDIGKSKDIVKKSSNEKFNWPKQKNVVI